MQQLETQLIDYISHPLQLIGSLLSIGAAAAILIFIWGLIDYFYSRGNDDEKKLGNILTTWAFTWFIILFLLWRLVLWISAKV